PPARPFPAATGPGGRAPTPSRRAAVSFRPWLAPSLVRYRAPPGPRVTSLGSPRLARRAGVPLATQPPHRPVPATVEITPDGDTARIRLFPMSAKYSVPDRATAIPPGSFSEALAAGPPSPEKPPLPFLATTADLPPGSTRRISFRPSSDR